MLVSVVVTSYNYQKYIKDTIISVLNQTFKDWEMIVIDDASTDASVKIIQELTKNDSRVKLIQNSENIGLKNSIKKALKEASGEWIAFLESDDLWREDYLEKKTALINEGRHFGFIFNDVELFGNTVYKTFPKVKGKFPRSMFYAFGISNPVLTMSSVMVKKNLLELIDFNTPIDKLLDWYIYIQLARLTDFYYLSAKLTKWRQHEKSYISKNEKCKFKFANISAYLKILKKEPFNLKLWIFIIFAAAGMCIKRLSFYTARTAQKIFRH